AVALMPSVDSAAGSVIATCLNDPGRSDPTLALAQRMWDAPDELVRCFEPAHPLLRHGLLVVEGQWGWNASLAVPALVARELLFPGGDLPVSLQLVTPRALAGVGFAPTTLRSALRPGNHMQIVPVIGRVG